MKSYKSHLIENSFLAPLLLATSLAAGGGEKPKETPTKPTTTQVNGKLTADDLVDVGAVNDKMTATNPKQWYYGRAMLSPEAAKGFKAADDAFFAETGKRIRINSAYRSQEHQQALRGRHPVVAKPGTSRHGMGMAIDVPTGSPEFQWLKTNGAKYGWKWGNIPNDPCHFGFCGTPAPSEK